MEPIAGLNAPTAAERLEAVRLLAGSAPGPAAGRDVNNHIHTTYSFSPYSPSLAVWRAKEAGLCTAGLMDHDSVGGAREFLAAAEILRLPVTVGMECRVSFADTPFAERRINNTEQPGIGYIALHGIPHNQLDAADSWMRPYREIRFARSRAMTRRLNGLLPGDLPPLDYERDVEPLSQVRDSGTVTERHLLLALARSICTHAGRGRALPDWLRSVLDIKLGEKQALLLGDEDNPCLEHDLLGVLKAEFLERFYIPAQGECPPVSEAAAFARDHGVVLAYAYLGDVGESVTGDKKAQRFEDEYLEELLDCLHALGFEAITYMPARNTAAQLARLQELCRRFSFFEICGEDINSPRQSFLCPALRCPEFSHLYDAAWALIGHELRAETDLRCGMFSPETKRRWPVLSDRVGVYRDAALCAHGRKE